LHATNGRRPGGRAQAVADRLGRWSPGGASAERMYRTLTDPGYQKTTNKHGRRLNARCGTPMCAPAPAWAQTCRWPRVGRY